jgi:beta-galactosidase GanA
VDDAKIKALFKMLLESGFHFNIFNEKGLLENLNKFKLVILPDQRYIEPELASALREYVRNGGSLIATGLTGTQDSTYKSTGKFVLDDVFGIRLEEKKYPHSHSYMKIIDKHLKKDVLDMPQQAFGDVTYVTSEGAQTLAELWDLYLRGDGKYLLSSSPPGKPTGHPAVTIHKFGKGKAAYFAQDIFTAYTHRIQWNLKNVFRNLINLSIPEKLIETNAPSMVEVVLNKKGKDLQVNMVNHYREKSLGEAISITEKVIPIHNIQVKLKVEGKPKSVMLVPEKKKLDWKMKDGYLIFKVPELHIYSIAVIEQ